MKILLIDNYDSFTFNLYQQIRSLGADVDVVKNDRIGIADIHHRPPDRIVISPGPGSPADSGVSLDVIYAFHESIPILGVCLGHQCLAEVFKAKGNPRPVIPAPSLMHGKTSRIYHGKKGLMRGIPSPFTAARYHSLTINRVPPGFELMCWTGAQSARSGRGQEVIMGIMHETLPVFGVQFHPESFMTEYGNRLMRNFLGIEERGSPMKPKNPKKPTKKVRRSSDSSDSSASSVSSRNSKFRR